MHVESHEIRVGRITDAHGGERDDEEERQDSERTVPYQLHPEVAHLDTGGFALVHHDALLTLEERDEQQYQTRQGEDAHGEEPRLSSLGGVIDRLHLTRLRVQYLWCEENDDQRERLDDQSCEISHDHAHTGKDGNLIGVARKRCAQCSVRHIDQCEAHAQSYIRDIGIEQRSAEPVPETQHGEGSQRDSTEQQPRAVFAPAWVRLIHHRPHHRVPYHVDDTYHKEHHGHHRRIQSKDIVIVEQ